MELHFSQELIENIAVQVNLRMRIEQLDQEIAALNEYMEELNAQ